MNKIALIMGSQSDWETMKFAADVLDEFELDYDKLIISAHRTPDRLYNFAKDAEKNYSIIIAGAGGSAHLPGMVASITTLSLIHI